MNSEVHVARVSTGALWAGRVVSALPALMLLSSGAMKLAKPPAVVDGFAHLGIPVRLIVGIAILEIACTVVYLIPQTAALGAVLLTGYLGGATLTHLRVGEPVYAPVVLGVLVWLGLFLRDRRVRAILPLRPLLPAMGTALPAGGFEDAQGEGATSARVGSTR